MAWGWFYLSTVLSDFVSDFMGRKTCTRMSVGDVNASARILSTVSGGVVWAWILWIGGRPRPPYPRLHGQFRDA
jgi:hypothetical protein